VVTSQQSRIAAIQLKNSLMVGSNILMSFQKIKELWTVEKEREILIQRFLPSLPFNK
jgi:plasmid maintenance system antidote protein VapI